MTDLAAEKRRVLVGEDDDAARALLARYLEGKGFAVVAVADGQAVLDALAAPDGYDLVLLDVMMPRVSGFDVLAQARGRGDTTPIIMATAAATADDVVRALESGADDYVTKPFSFPVLLARIELRLRLRAAKKPPAPPADEVDASEHVLDSQDAGPSFMQRIRRAAERLKHGVARAPLAHLEPGSTLAERYVIGDKIGEGGFGLVFRARHVDLGQDVAVKVLHRNAGAGAVDGFRREAQNACRVRHPNAVRVFDFGVLPGSSAFLVMELLEGPTLEQLVKQSGKLAPARALSIASAVLAALAAAHQQGLVHRDVKMQNVVLHAESTGEVPKLLDFGIAKLTGDLGDTGNVIMGSGAYIAPERLRGRKYDGRADVYGVGIMLYRMLTASFPFSDVPGIAGLEDFENIALWHLHAEPAPPSKHVPSLSSSIDDVVLRLLEKDPARRPDADAARALLDAIP